MELVAANRLMISRQGISLQLRGVEDKFEHITYFSGWTAELRCNFAVYRTYPMRGGNIL